MTTTDPEEHPWRVIAGLTTMQTGPARGSLADHRRRGASRKGHFGFVSTGDIEDSRISYDAVSVAGMQPSNVRDAVLRPGDVIVAVRGTVLDGKVALVHRAPVTGEQWLATDGDEPASAWDAWCARHFAVSGFVAGPNTAVVRYVGGASSVLLAGAAAFALLQGGSVMEELRRRGTAGASRGFHLEINRDLREIVASFPATPPPDAALVLESEVLFALEQQRAHSARRLALELARALVSDSVEAR